jgi:hypothetical protein
MSHCGNVSKDHHTLESRVIMVDVYVEISKKSHYTLPAEYVSKYMDLLRFCKYRFYSIFVSSYRI